MTKDSLQRGSIPDRIGEFFTNNPDEFLTFDDAVIKFGCSRRVLTNTLAKLKKRRVCDAVYVIRKCEVAE